MNLALPEGPAGPRQVGPPEVTLGAGVSSVRLSGHEASVTVPQLCSWGVTTATDDTQMKACGHMPRKLNTGRWPASAPGEQLADPHFRITLGCSPHHQGGEAVFCWRTQASPHFTGVWRGRGSCLTAGRARCWTRSGQELVHVAGSEPRARHSWRQATLRPARLRELTRVPRPTFIRHGSVTEAPLA